MLSREIVADPVAGAVLAGSALSAVSAWVAASGGSPGSRPLGRLSTPAGVRGGPPGGGRRWRVTRPAAPLATAVVGLAVLFHASGSPALLGPIAVLAIAVRSAVRRRRQAQAELGRLDACGALLDGLAAELRSGRLPRDALARAVDSAGLGVVGRGGSPALSMPGPAQAGLRRTQIGAELLRPVGAAAQVDGDVPAVLRRQALLPGAAVLGWLAACWTVSEQRGAGLAGAAERIARTAQVEREHRAETAAELSAARATARLLAVLPLVGIGLGHAMGADVLGVLFGSALGAVLISVAVALLATGVAWVDALARHATGRRSGS